ncbi:hypothetical protein QFC21_001180 [Naganishia friedmannii]|uniref:Uncharacterized protein n=1 Tax=Naganishia friedmannii TaxID=89922 RepID=A0ACC2W8T2_9TREE|nr:hypothetical protein QFC21_001180 [Naganishia friedmannii]
MSTPAVPPPQYTDSTPKPKTYGAAEGSHSDRHSLLGHEGPSSSRGNAWIDQPEEDDLPDDFKVGVNVADCDVQIRMGFVRKVYRQVKLRGAACLLALITYICIYSILFAQLLATTLVSAALHHPSAQEFTRQNPWLLWVSIFGSFGTLLAVHFKRHQYPANMVLLGAFTMFESLMIGTVTSYYSARIVLQALIITTGVFVGLTLFTFQSKYDFSNMGPYLFAGLMGMLVTGIVQIFLPFNHTTDLVIACFGVLLFSGYTVYDTHAIMKRLSPDEYILGALSLYLDFINLFLYILRVLNNQERD